MTRSTGLLLLLLLAAAGGAFGYWLYQEQNRGGIDITVGGRGVSIRER
jgi:hypothetical protein